MIFEQHLQLEERLDAVFGGRAPPFAIRGGRRLNDGVDVGRGGERRLRDGLSGGRIDHVAPLRRFRFHPGAVEIVQNFLVRVAVVPVISVLISGAIGKSVSMFLRDLKSIRGGRDFSPDEKRRPIRG